MTDLLRQQYETFPYPLRDPQEEKTRLLEGHPSHLLEVDHYIFGGRRDFRQPLRVLVAGGGTGDAVMMLGQHLADRGCPAELVYLDLSTASRAIAEARAAGAAGWLFHTSAGFELGKKPFLDALSPDERAGLQRLRQQ